MQNRRDFLKTSAVALCVVGIEGGAHKRILIQAARDAGFQRRLAERELMRGLRALGLSCEISLAETPAPGALFFALQPGSFNDPEAFTIALDGDRVVLSAASDQALLYAVFEYLERQGAYFGLDGPGAPLDAPPTLVTPPPGRPWTSSPRFAVRGLVPWPDFLNCITVYNREDFRAYFEAMLRMRFNTFGMHAYTQGEFWAESYLSFEFAGAGHNAFLDTSATSRWGYLPERTSRFTMGGADFYDGEVFGSDATRFARDPWEAAERTRTLLREALGYAARLGLRTGIGFEPYQIPDEILRALPPEAKPPKGTPGARFNIESVTARDLLESRLAQLLEAYPEADHVWLWEDEGMNWESRKTGIPLSVTPFLQAHDFLRRHAPRKRLVLAGWGGVARNFEYLHRKLPGDIVFSCLSDSLGWDPVHEVFSKLEGRERWPVLWIEDDPGMWLPQFHVHRFARDMRLAEQYGCQGLLGIHWRHRIVDATAGFQSRRSWSAITPEEHYHHYAQVNAAAARAPKLAAVLADADQNQTLLSTGGADVKDGHVVTREYAGDYGEGFMFWNAYEPEPRLLASQQQVAEALGALAAQAQSPAERERLSYLAGFVDLLVPYSEAWVLAHRIQGVLNAAAGLKKSGQAEAARAKVREEAVPLWLTLAPQVRRVMLEFQAIAATRNDLGQLASMHNKFVRLALVRLRLSMKEYLGELPVEAEAALKEATACGGGPRLFLPTRPTVLARGESVRITLVAPGTRPEAGVTVFIRQRGGEWLASPAGLLGRRTWEAILGPFDGAAELVDYYARCGNEVAPAGAPGEFYTLTVV